MNVMAPTMQVACKAFIVPNPAARSPKERYTHVLMGNAQARRRIRLGCVTFTGAVAKMRRQRRGAGCTTATAGTGKYQHERDGKHRPRRRQLLTKRGRTALAVLRLITSSNLVGNCTGTIASARRPTHCDPVATIRRKAMQKSPSTFAQLRNAAISSKVNCLQRISM